MNRLARLAQGVRRQIPPQMFSISKSLTSSFAVTPKLFFQTKRVNIVSQRTFSINLSSVTQEDSKPTYTYNDFILTDSCVAQINKLKAQHGPNTALRVLVDTGGCSGFQYNFNKEQLENPAEFAADSPAPCVFTHGDDFVFQRDGVTVLVDDVSMPFMKGAQLDYKTEMIRSAFAIIDNPNVELACGCGTSFSKKK